MLRQTLFRTMATNGVNTIAMGFYRRAERLGSIPNAAWANRNVWSRSRVGVVDKWDQE